MSNMEEEVVLTAYYDGNSPGLILNIPIDNG
jgi:hypothetical protein